MKKGFGTLVSEIDGIANFHLKQGLELDINSSEIKDYIDTLSRIINEVQSLGELESRLIDNFGEGEILNGGNFRLANAIGFENTLIRRRADKIILPNGETEMPTETNMGGNVIDPIAWSSKPVAPSRGYGLLGKISELRRNSQNYDEELHAQIMNREIKLTSKGLAIEVGKDETVIMPSWSAKGANDLIQQFSEVKQEGDIQTSKHYAINS